MIISRDDAARMSQVEAASPPDSHVHSAVAITSAINGGGEQYVRGLYGAGRPFGLLGTLVGNMPGWTDAGLPAVPVRVTGKWSRKNHGLGRALLAMPTDRSRLLAACRRLSEISAVDIIHLQYKREQVLLTRRASAFAPVVWSELGAFPRTGTLTTYGLRNAYRRAAGAVEAIVCVSPGVRDELHGILGPAGPELIVIENGVDLGRYHPPATEDDRRAARQQLGVAEHRPIVVTLARLIPWKRIDRLVAAAAKAPDLMFVIAGDGPERGRVEAMAGRNVRILGHVADTADLLRAADCAVCCSEPHREGLPGALLEYAATGLPIVSLRGSVSDQYAESSGAVLAEDEEGLVGAIREGLRGTPNSAGLQWARNRSIQSVALAHLELFRHVAST